MSLLPRLAWACGSAMALLVLNSLLSGCGDDEQNPDSSAGGASNDGGLGGTDPASGGALSDGGRSMPSGGASTFEGASGASGSEAGGVGGDANAPETSSGSSGDGGSSGESSCVPRTCTELGACGGQIADGCGQTIECPPCPDTCKRKSVSGFARRARSASFAGTDAQYSGLFSVDCTNAEACVEPCTTAGGTAELCSNAECVVSTQNYCLPPPVWANLEAATVQGSDPELDGATLVLVARPYRDELLVDRFQLEVPADARIEGVEVTVRRAADFPDSAADNSIRLIKGGTVVGLDRSGLEQWAAGSFQDVTYGSPTDSWGEEWTAADLVSPEFGVALSVKYTQSAGNARAYVDLATIRVHYAVECN